MNLVLSFPIGKVAPRSTARTTPSPAGGAWERSAVQVPRIETKGNGIKTKITTFQP
jgi:hypothetical protein